MVNVGKPKQFHRISSVIVMNGICRPVYNVFHTFDGGMLHAHFSETSVNNRETRAINTCSTY